MKLKSIVCTTLCISIIAVLSFIIINKAPKDETIFLEDRYYKENKKIEITKDNLSKLIDKKETFAVFIYQPMCTTSSNFEEILNEFLKDTNLTIYKISFSDIKETSLGKVVKFYPSFAIYNKGEIIDFLEADKDEDIEFYNSKEGFSKWFAKYIKIKEISPSANENTSSVEEGNKNQVAKDIELKDVTKDKSKVNIYFFWGNGCPHCAEEFKFFESIKEKYGDYYNLYTFETWYDEENAEILESFATAMGDKITGVPYTIIGKKSFKGYGDSSKEKMISAIENEYKSNYDVYFDKIKTDQKN